LQPQSRAAMAVAGGDVTNHVPHYNVYGHQHHREPFKDKSYLLNEDIRHPRWLQPAPAIRTNPELRQARKAARIPDASYDFDGDGAVGQLDHFIGRCFDSDNDGKLTKTERRKAEKALEDGFMDRFVRCDSVGKAVPIQQRRGIIIVPENAADVGKSYAPHFNAHKQPPNTTKTALQVSRTAELKAGAAPFGERLAAAAAPVDEPQPANHLTRPRKCHVEHLWERAEADRQAGRVHAGLLPVDVPTNPERELKGVGLDYVDEPHIKTRTQLLETRRDAMKDQAERLRVKGEDTFVEQAVELTIKEANAYEFRRPSTVPVTFTQIKEQRRRDKIEHDMANFQLPRGCPKEYPRFSDNPEVPFWVTERASQPRASSAPTMSRTSSEPVMKVTEVPWGHALLRDSGKDLPDAAHTLTVAGKESGALHELGSHTIKRWTTDQLERGAGRNKPRMFDNVVAPRISPKDLEALELSSSLEPVRTAALRQLAEDRKAASHKKSALFWEAEQRRASTTISVKPERASSKLAPTAEASTRPEAPPSVQQVQQYGRERRSSKASLRPRSSSVPVLLEPTTMALDKFETAPRFFGSASAITRPTTQTAVRSGGFSGGLLASVETSPARSRLGGRR